MQGHINLTDDDSYEFVNNWITIFFSKLYRRKTKRAQELAQRYVESTATSLADVYKTGGSAWKRAAEQQIISEMKSAGGYGYKILSHDSFVFSAAYLLDAGNMVFHTRYSRHLVEI